MVNLNLCGSPENKSSSTHLHTTRQGLFGANLALLPTYSEYPRFWICSAVTTMIEAGVSPNFSALLEAVTTSVFNRLINVFLGFTFKSSCTEELIIVSICE